MPEDPSESPDRADEPVIGAPMISYAQNHEDVLLERCFRDVKEGFYIDVGAWDPTIDSVTCHFYGRGWHGINVEPVHDYYQRLVQQRPRDVNLQCILGETEGTHAFTVIKGSGLSTVRRLDDSFVADLEDGGYGSEVVEVPERTLASVCEQYVPQGVEVDFLKIDVEGFEAEVLAGADWSSFRPRVMVVEAMQPVAFDIARGSPIVEDMSHKFEPAVLANGFLFATTDGINRFYVRQEDAELIGCFEHPVNVLDHYAPYEIFRVTDERDRLRQELAHQTAANARETARLNGELDQKAALLNQSRATLEATEHGLRETENLLRDTEGRVESLLGSTSWRVTKPLRAVTGWMRREGS